MTQVKWCERCEQSLELDLCRCPPPAGCDCDGCSFCVGHVIDCTCHIDWDEVHDRMVEARLADLIADDLAARGERFAEVIVRTYARGSTP